MENISGAIQKIGNKAGFQQRLTEMKEIILAEPQVRHFLNAHSSQITEEMVEKSLNKLYEFSTQVKDCQGCSSVATCQNLLKGHQPRLFIQGKRIEVSYEPCHNKLIEDERRSISKLVNTIHVPKEILNATFSRVDANGELGRLNAVRKAMTFVKQYKAGNMEKGLYLHGSFGVGKTFLLGAIANLLSEQGVASYIVYWPEYLRELKGSFADHTYNKKVDALKAVPVLMIDDIGAETMSSWARDEVLGPILQYRMQENLPTFFTSNFNFKQLEHHFTFSQRGEEETVKGKRIMERITHMTEAIEMDGINRR